jgi:hypothetical protein
MRPGNQVRFKAWSFYLGIPSLKVPSVTWELRSSMHWKCQGKRRFNYPRRRSMHSRHLLLAAVALDANNPQDICASVLRKRSRAPAKNSTPMAMIARNCGQTVANPAPR